MRGLAEIASMPVRFKTMSYTYTHIADPTKRSTMLCGRGYGAKGHPSITTISFPSVTSLPTCRTCREIFLASIGVEVDDNGYPKTEKV